MSDEQETTTPRDEPRPSRTRRTRPRAAAETAAPETPKESKPPRVAPTDRKLKASIQSTYESLSLATIGFGMAKQDQGLIGTGQVMAQNAEAAADAWLELADQNPSVKKALRRFAEGSAVATLLTVHISMCIPLAASRGVLPAPFMAMAGATFAGGGMPGENGTNGATETPTPE